MKKKNLSILSNTKESPLGFGDYLRILSFVPNLKYKNIYWISNPEIFTMVKEVSFIKKCYLIGSEESKKILSESDFIFNLYEEGVNTDKIFFLNSLIKDEKNIKLELSDLLNQLSNFFKLNTYKLHTNTEYTFNIENDIFCSWKVPKKWSIKEYPQSHWEELKDLVKKKLNLNMTFQNEDDDLKKLIEKIKHSRLIISINGLAVHVAMLLNKPLIMLSGPNHLNDLEKYSKASSIFPENFCEHRPCSLPTGVNHCGCMGDIKVSKIFEEIKKYINE